MQSLNHSSYLALREGAKVLEADGSGDKVLLLADGRFLKLFRRKRVFTSAALFPYATRFASNTQRLIERGIPCPTVLNVWRIPSIERDGVYYEPLAGDTLRQLMADPATAQSLRAQFGTFVARLHNQGVYFRSLHLGNVVLTPHGSLGLIDIADLRCYRRSLSASKRLRNFQHMMRYKADLQWLRGDDTAHTFLEGYRQALPDALANSGLMPRLGASLA